jgi:uncharacterized protein YggU (UPF0235/DUF167 family)
MFEASTSSWLSGRPDGVRLAVKVTPRAAQSAVQGIEVDARGQAYLAVRVAAAPDAGKANVALIRLLAKRWRLPASAVRLVAGATARRKILHVAGAPERLLAELATLEQPRRPPGEERR